MQITKESQEALYSQISVKLVELGTSVKGIVVIHDRVYDIFKLFQEYASNNRTLLEQPKENPQL